MTTFAERLKYAMEQRDMKASELSRRAEVSKARISQYIHGRYVPGADGVCRLASVLGVSEAWLVGQSANMDASAALPEGVAPLTMHAVPLLGEIACGKPILAVEDIEGYVAVCDHQEADFCLIAKGDSMTGARIYDGDRVFIQRAEMVNNGDIAAVVVEDEATLKRVYYYPEEHKIILFPENPDYQPLVFVGDELNDIRILGKAIAVQMNL